MTKPVADNETVGPIKNDSAEKKKREKMIKELVRRSGKVKKIIEGLEESQKVSQETMDIEFTW